MVNIFSQTVNKHNSLSWVIHNAPWSSAVKSMLPRNAKCSITLLADTKHIFIERFMGHRFLQEAEQLPTYVLLCLVPRPHFSSRPKRFASRGPWENVRPRQKSSEVRQKWDSSMAMVNKISVSNFKVKNTSLKHTDGRGISKRILSFPQVDKGRLFRLYKIVLRGI